MAKLSARFNELLDFDWREFCDLERSGQATMDDAVLVSLIRVCADSSDVGAIKTSFDRTGGLLEDKVDIKAPKFYIRYLNAKSIEPGDPKADKAIAKKDEPVVIDRSTAKLRATLHDMRSMPQGVVDVVLDYKERVERLDDVPSQYVPKVRSVIVANLLKMVNRGKTKAISLVFDQIDGKLPKTIVLVNGEDIYLDNYIDEIAPSDAILGEDGVYFAENKALTELWRRGFATSKKGLESLMEGDSDE